MGTQTKTASTKTKAGIKSTTRPATRRIPQQVRGQQRVETILNAAEAYFVDVGYEAATTNELAARAGVSIGSIYQFFPNKTAILQAVVARYRDYFAAQFDAALSNSQALSVGEIASRMIDVAVRAKVERGSFVRMLMMSTPGGELHEAGCELHESILQRIADLIGERAPHMPVAQRRLYATVSQTAFAAHLGVALTESGHSHTVLSQQLIEQAKLMQTAYFETVLAKWLSA